MRQSTSRLLLWSAPSSDGRRGLVIAQAINAILDSGVPANATASGVFSCDGNTCSEPVAHVSPR